MLEMVSWMVTWKARGRRPTGSGGEENEEGEYAEQRQ